MGLNLIFWEKCLVFLATVGAAGGQAVVNSYGSHFAFRAVGSVRVIRKDCFLYFSAFSSKTMTI
jgi:hypothetical protein